MQIPIVNENDQVIRHIERDDRDENLIYRVSYLWITDTDGKVLLARRSPSKNHSPNMWGPAVAGTVEGDETYEENIIKEAREELGLENIKPTTGAKQRVRSKYQYFRQEFLLTLPTGFNDFKIQEDEVAEVRWFTKTELVRAVAERPEDFLEIVRERK